MKINNLTLIMLLGFTSKTMAEIVYTDIKPDITIQNTLYEMDLDNDGKNDIVFENTSNYENGEALAQITFKHPHIKIIGQPISGRNNDGGVSLLHLNDKIDRTSSFITNYNVTNANAAIAFIGNGIEYKPWVGQSNEFIGFSIKNTITNEFHYGWIEISFSTDFILTVHGMGLEDISYTPIKAGQKLSNQTPTAIRIDNSSIDENLPLGTFIGRLSSEDADVKDSHSYSLISGTNSSDNTHFIITGDSLLSNTIFDFESKASYSIRIKTDDGHEGTYEEAFTIVINDIHNASVQQLQSTPICVYPNPAQTFIEIKNIPLNSSLKLNAINGSIIREIYPQSSSIKVDVSTLTAGMYWLSIESPMNGKETQLITIE